MAPPAGHPRAAARKGFWKADLNGWHQKRSPKMTCTAPGGRRGAREVNMQGGAFAEVWVAVGSEVAGPWFPRP